MDATKKAVGVAVAHGLRRLYVNLERAYCDKAAYDLRLYHGDVAR
jgi:hypothetical protein